MEKKKIIYDGYLHKGVSAEQIEEYLLDVEKRCGSISASILVEEAEPNDALLHNFFEWDDNTAAQLYRLTQARAIISKVKYVIVDEGSPVRAFGNVTYVIEDTEVTAYHSMNSIISDPKKMESLLRNAKQDWEIYKSKYKNLRQIAARFEDFDKAFTVAH